MSLTPEKILLLVAAVLAIVEIFEARGRHLLGWAVLIIVGVLLFL